jgi:hypothetical protein
MVMINQEIAVIVIAYDKLIPQAGLVRIYG